MSTAENFLEISLFNFLCKHQNIFERTSSEVPVYCRNVKKNGGKKLLYTSAS